MFNKVVAGDEVFGLVYGFGIVNEVWDNSFYHFQVIYKNGYQVPYDINGVPGWGSFEFQTVFYKNEIDLSELDLSPSTGDLTPKKIVKLRSKGKLEAKCPSGNWMNIQKCPGSLVEQYLEQCKLHLFRKAI